MKAAVAIAVVLALGGAVLAYFVLDPFGDDSDPTASLHLQGSACERLAGLAAHLADTDDSVNDFLLDLGQQAGGISTGRRALADLARGGRNRIVGKGFRQRYDDGSIGQVRHFVGYVRASMFGGAFVTRWISEHLRHDPADSPDGRLGDQGIAFEGALVSGRLEPSEASGWLLSHLCRRPTAIYRSTVEGTSGGGA
jgi:hypothetical protein